MLFWPREEEPYKTVVITQETLSEERLCWNKELTIQKQCRWTTIWCVIRLNRKLRINLCNVLIQDKPQVNLRRF